ncbi:MAG: bifunctional pyr operon transcriptional regulator/uracil phosphoribosyltransferase PyrR [Eubacteriales bacterium]|nr:bifunctional pyr operon transcriptional regulator/uracil phosphoribosyltransferase PyrR [Eubacteriales bacterium]
MKKEGYVRKSELMDEASINRSILRMTHEIIEKNEGALNLVFLGIKTRGIPLAKRLADNIFSFTGRKVPFAPLDVTAFRDDIPHEKEVLPKDSLPFSVEGKIVVLVDDVFYTGRTARAAMETVFYEGRPKKIQLAVLVDRGHRELPIRADYVGKNVPTSHNESVEVCLKEIDGVDAVYIGEKEEKE